MSPLSGVGDQREQPGAMLTDGTHLFEVLDARQVNHGLRPPEWHVWVEDASSGRIREFDSRDVCQMRLVRAAQPQEPIL